MAILYKMFIGVLIFVSIPIQVIVGALIMIFSDFPIIFWQKRVGKNGKPFTIYKFRTMHIDAEQKKQALRFLNESDGAAFKIYNDPRFTRIGKALSRTGLDELPQLYNVARGDMALFGPRPLPVDEVKQLKSWMRKREDALPGIISPAILTGNYHKNFNAWMKSDCEYVTNKSFGTDLRLFFRFIPFIGSLLVKGLT